MNDQTQAVTSTSVESAKETDAKVTETPATETSVTETSAAEKPPVETPAKVSEAAVSNSDGPEADKASDRLKIGTQRNEGDDAAKQLLKPKPVHSVTEGESVPQSTTNYPPPNVRDQLSPEQEEELAAIMGETSVEEVLEASAANAPKELEPETKLSGKVVRVHGDSVFLDLGNHQQGVLPLKQFEPKASSPTAPASVVASPSVIAASPAEASPAKETPAAETKEGEAPAAEEAKSHAPEIGCNLDVVVARLNADEGIYEVSLPTAAVDIGNWDEVEAGQTVEVSITGKNKGGLECTVSGIRGFMPMGQISIYRVENPEEFIGQRLTAVITEANRSKRNLILSHRAVMERDRSAKKEQLLAELAPGQERDGIVRSLRDFGAFVDLGGVDGLVHVSKLSWDRVGHPKDILTEGQAIKVKVEKIDAKTGKIALSYREMVANPWDKVEENYAPGSTIKGKVSKIMDFGAFVRLEPGVEGLIHISEIDYKRVHRTSDVLSEGQDVEAKVVSVDRDKQRIALSLKALMAAPVKEEKVADEDMPLPADAPKKPRRQDKNLKGGTGGPSGGQKFGLKW